MAQYFNQILQPPALFARNIGINSAAGETVVLDKIPGLGFRNLTVVIVNRTGASSACSLYGSPDAVNWIAISTFSTFAVGTAAIGYAAATGMFQYFRVSITGVADQDVYLYGQP